MSEIDPPRDAAEARLVALMRHAVREELEDLVRELEFEDPRKWSGVRNRWSRRLWQQLQGGR